MLRATLKQSPKGFTLVEMIVVLAIIVIITMIAVLGQSSFNRSLILTDSAYTIAFSVREAQALGLSSRRTSTGAQDAGYGVYFSKDSPESYTLFADILPATAQVQSSSECPGHRFATGPEAKPGNCIFDFPNQNEVVRTYSLNRGFRISDFCGMDGSTLRCASNNTLSAMNIAYVRGSTNSVIIGMNGATRIPLSSATVRIASPDGAASRCIYVSQVGQVAVLQPGEPNCP